jgi:homoserine kinase
MSPTRGPTTVRVRAPATSANLGPGFDCLGLALDLWAEVLATPLPAARPDPPPADSLILRAARRVFDLAGAPLPGLALETTDRIPFGRGLGSSAAAIACGVLLANELLGRPLAEADLLDVAAGVEGHPDNVVPCLLGGVRAVACDGDGHILQAAVPLAAPLVAAVFVPELRVPTQVARAALPATVPLADALFNVGRSALLVAALASGQTALLRAATQDRLHQPYRTPLFPPMPALIDAALAAGALGAYSSGAGPSVLALCADDAGAAAVCQALARAAARAAAPGCTLTAAISPRGAHVVHAA